jgi:hypothetical protein
MLAILLALSVASYAATIPPGSKLTVRLGSEISSATTKAGQTFDGELANDVVVNGKTIAAAGTPVKGKVTYAGCMLRES